uniref:G protein-coupled receptor n=1 Tax=Heterorhabditis bacteriophora TaxID=37862 RepID=A0A1I7WQH1_HETBA
MCVIAISTIFIVSNSGWFVFSRTVIPLEAEECFAMMLNLRNFNMSPNHLFQIVSSFSTDWNVRLASVYPAYEFLNVIFPATYDYNSIFIIMLTG